MDDDIETEWVTIHNEMVELLKRIENFNRKWWVDHNGKIHNDMERSIDRFKESMMWWQLERGYHLDELCPVPDMEGG